MKRLPDYLAVRLVAFVMLEHDFNSDSCWPTAGVDCWAWCSACGLLKHIPAELTEAATALIAEGEAANVVEPPF